MSGTRPPPGRRAPGRRRMVVRGLLLLGLGRSEGFECFDGGRDAFLAGLAPPIGFLVVLAVLLLLQHPSAAAFCIVLLLLCGVLLPPVISHAMARLWRRDERWQRYATASIWSNWLILPAYLPAMLVAGLLLGLGVGQSAAAEIMLLLIGGYFLWLQWFLAWKGLSIGRLQAVLTVMAVTFGSSMVVVALEPLMPEIMLLQNQADGTAPAK